MTYFALLRGINVGGNAKVEMLKLKSVFESVGCKNVSTYINSGNVIFSDDRDKNTLAKIINSAIIEELKMDIPIVIRDSENIQVLCNSIPLDWTNDDEQKTDVLFLWDEINNADILSKIVINPNLENVKYLPGALVWNIGRENVTKGNGIKLVKNDLYKYMTARNINTVRKLNELMKIK